MVPDGRIVHVLDIVSYPATRRNLIYLSRSTSCYGTKYTTHLRHDFLAGHSLRCFGFYCRTVTRVVSCMDIQRDYLRNLPMILSFSPPFASCPSISLRVFSIKVAPTVSILFLNLWWWDRVSLGRHFHRAGNLFPRKIPTSVKSPTWTRPMASKTSTISRELSSREPKS